MALTTRSYLVLGLLAIDDWTTYELARQLERGFADIWSASRTMVYDEPAKLVAQRLASARVEKVGQRTRTRYSITASGRTALMQWLATPGAGPAMQFEGLLKVLLADTVEPGSIGPSLSEARAWAHRTRETGTEVARQYSRGEGPFQERSDMVAMSFAFLWDFADLVDRWASWAAQHSVQSSGGDDPTPVTAAFQRALDGQAAIPRASRPSPTVG